MRFTGDRALSAMLAGLALTMSVTELGAAKIWKGKWGGQAPSTLQFLQGNRVKYCFQTSCTVQPFTGSENGTLRFNRDAASLRFDWNGHGYSGTWDLVILVPVYRALHSTIVME